MAYGSQPRWTDRSAATQVGIDVGLRDYMLRVYNYMASALALTGVVAWVFAGYLETHRAILHSPVMWLIILAPLGLVMLLSVRHRPAERGGLAGHFLALRGIDGAVAVGDLPGLHRRQHRPDVLHHRRDVRRR